MPLLANSNFFWSYGPHHFLYDGWHYIPSRLKYLGLNLNIRVSCSNNSTFFCWLQFWKKCSTNTPKGTNIINIPHFDNAWIQLSVFHVPGVEKSDIVYQYHNITYVICRTFFILSPYNAFLHFIYYLLKFGHDKLTIFLTLKVGKWYR